MAVARPEPGELRGSGLGEEEEDEEEKGGRGRGRKGGRLLRPMDYSTRHPEDTWGAGPGLPTSLGIII